MKSSEIHDDVCDRSCKPSSPSAWEVFLIGRSFIGIASRDARTEPTGLRRGFFLLQLPHGSQLLASAGRSSSPTQSRLVLFHVLSLRQ